MEQAHFNRLPPSQAALALAALEAMQHPPEPPPPPPTREEIIASMAESRSVGNGPPRWSQRELAPSRRLLEAELEESSLPPPDLTMPETETPRPPWVMWGSYSRKNVEP